MQKMIGWLKKKVGGPTFWGVLGVVGMCVTFVIGYYFPHERKPSISFEITNEANVLDVHKPLRDLTIRFRGKDIQGEDLNLRIFTIRIENAGGVDILENHYSSYDIWGFQIRNGKIIEVRLIDSNDNNIKRELNPQLLKEDTVQFRKIIFDRRAFFTLEVLVLHPRNTLPELIPCGKIGGIPSTIAAYPRSDKSRKPFLLEFLHGNILIHAVRFLGYLFTVALFIIAVGFLEVTIERLRKNRKTKMRRNEAKKILGIESLKERSKSKILADDYVFGGLEKLKQLQALLEDKEKLSKKIKKYKKANKIEKLLVEFKDIDPKSKDVVDVPDFYIDMMLIETGYKSYKDIPKIDFVKEGLIREENGKIIIDKKFKNLLDRFIVELEA